MLRVNSKDQQQLVQLTHFRLSYLTLSKYNKNKETCLPINNTTICVSILQWHSENKFLYFFVRVWYICVMVHVSIWVQKIDCFDYFIKSAPLRDPVLCFIKSNQQRRSIKNSVPKNVEKITGEHLCQSLFLNRSTTLLKKRFWHMRFPANFVKSSRTPFL